MHMYGWKGGLKTGLYYLRSTAATYGSAPMLQRGDAPMVGGAEPCATGACGA